MVSKRNDVISGGRGLRQVFIQEKSQSWGILYVVDQGEIEVISRAHQSPPKFVLESLKVAGLWEVYINQCHSGRTNSSL